MKRPGRILVVDDDAAVVAWLVDALFDEGFEVVGHTSASAALSYLQQSPVDVVVSDVEMPEMRGIEFLRHIKKTSPGQAVLLITAFGSIDLAMDAVRAGAIDFLAKPFRIEVLVLALERALRERRLQREVLRLRQASCDASYAGIAARSVAMQRVLELARRAARSTLPILVTGESGVGKGMLARYVHEQSDRKSAKYIQLNCAALPAGLAESELFGVRRGAFTDARDDRAGVFEQAHQGTLFLDEIGELPMEVQPKLLQALESNHIRPLGATVEVSADVRIVSATNRPLEEAIAKRQFRSDVFHRINVVRIELPPLRERIDDIPPIVDQALQSISRRTQSPVLGVSEQAMGWLQRQRWPGNVRELLNAVERAAALSDRDILTEADFPAPLTELEPSVLEQADRQDWSLDELERAYIRRVLRKTGGHKAKAAKILGLDRRTLYRKAASLEEFSDAADSEASPESSRSER